MNAAKASTVEVAIVAVVCEVVTKNYVVAPHKKNARGNPYIMLQEEQIVNEIRQYVSCLVFITIIMESQVQW